MTMDFTPSPHAVFSNTFQACIDAAMEMADREREPRDYLGGSRLGVECERALGYEYGLFPKDPGREFPGKTLRVFDQGHDFEARMAEYMRLAGFTLLTERADGQQFGFYVAKDQDGRARIAGHLDGVITAVPDGVSMAPPALWECKALNDKSWNDTLKKGVQKSKPVYYVQMQIYMAYLDLTENPGLFTAMNKNTGDLYAELVPFDAAAAQAASDKGLRVVSATDVEELPRIGRDATDFRCKWCDWAARCWAGPTVAPAAPAPTWMGGKP